MISPTMKQHHDEATAAADDAGFSPGNNDGPVSSLAATQVAHRDNRPSPSIHEDLVSRHLARDERTREEVPDPVVYKLRDAVGAARQAAERANRVADAIMANEMQTVPARHRDTKNQCWKIAEPALRTLDAAMGTCRRELEVLTQHVATPPRPTDPAGYFLASEVRQRLAGLPDADREKAIASALAGGDDALVGAVIGASPFLSGVTKARQDALLGAWQRLRHGPVLDRIERLKKALADTERAGSLTLAYTSSLSNASIVRQAEASEARVAAALQS